MISWPLQRKILQGIVLVSGLYVMFPQLDLLKTIYTYPLIEPITPGLLAGGLMIYYAAMSLRGRM
jgi:hypothetical protein